MRKGSTDQSREDRRRDAQMESLLQALDDDNLVIKEIPDGPDSLMMAVSDALYFTSIYHSEIQQFCIRHLASIIASDKLPGKLANFRGNTMLWSDYSGNPGLVGFQKINFELVSLMFKVRVVVYTQSDDQYLNATIFNNKFENVIQLVRSRGNHFDSVYSKKYLQNAGISQNIVLNLLNRVFDKNRSQSSTPTKESLEWRNINGDKYVNLEKESRLEESRKAREPRERENSFTQPRSIHKRSVSQSNFEFSNHKASDDQMKFYNLFMNAKPSGDLLALIEKRMHLPSEDNINISSHLKFLEEPWYGSPAHDQPPRQQDPPVLRLGPGVDAMSARKGGSRAFFEDDHDISSLERSKSLAEPAAFLHTPPPGLTPKRYQVKTYNAEDQGNTVPSEGEIPTFSLPQLSSRSQSYQHNAEQAPHHDYSSPNSKNIFQLRTGGSRGLILSTNEEFNQTPTNAFGFMPGMDGLNFGGVNLGMGTNGDSEKKKPVIIDESQERYTGRLKFFDENKSYGFIVLDDDGSDVFVHYDDLQRANISKDLLKTARLGNLIRLSFGMMEYIGKYNRSRKATDIVFIA